MSVVLGKLKRLFGIGLRHQQQDLEAMLPDTVAKRSLTKWSVRGVDYFVGTPPTAEDLDAFKTELSAEGLKIDDVGMAVAGRSDPATDPPYFVFAFRFRTVPADILPEEVGVDRPDAGSWAPARYGSRDILVGTEAMVEQTEHQRGRPYVYNVGEVRFIVITDDKAWATDALASLRPDPLVERAARLVALPSGWRPGLSPFATAVAAASVRDHPECLAVAHDGSMVGHSYVPSLTVRYLGPWNDGDVDVDVDVYLHQQELVFRDETRDFELREEVRSVSRVTLPAGEALRIVLVTDEPDLHGSVAQVQYDFVTPAGPFGLWFMCSLDDLTRYESTFDETAWTFLRADLDPDGALQRYARGEMTREEYDKVAKMP